METLKIRCVVIPFSSEPDLNAAYHLLENTFSDNEFADSVFFKRDADCPKMLTIFWEQEASEFADRAVSLIETTLANSSILVEKSFPDVQEVSAKKAAAFKEKNWGYDRQSVEGTNTVAHCTTIRSCTPIAMQR